MAQTARDTRHVGQRVAHANSVRFNHYSEPIVPYNSQKITPRLVTSKLRDNFYLNLSSKEKWSHQSTIRRRSSSKQYVHHRLLYFSGTLRYRHSRLRVIEGHRKQSVSPSYHRWSTEHHTRRQDHHFKWRYHSWRFEANGSRTCGRNFFGEILSCWRGLHYAVCTPHREVAPIVLTADDWADLHTRHIGEISTTTL